jgi:uncharacterized protein (DUF305 family)
MRNLFKIGGSLLLLATILSACAAAPATPAMESMDHSAMEGMQSAAQPYDAVFIDSMIVHHEGAITMAEQALQQAERAEIRTLAEAIISAQQAEIVQLREWRAAWYPDLAATAGMGMDMGPLMVAEGPAPFDQRFIEAMIPHHEGAIAMARDALQKSERQEIRDLAQAVISAQEAEITQMHGWLKEWYGIE